MRYGNKFCSLILTSAICMIGANAWAASSVRVLGAANSGASSSGTSATAKTGTITVSTKPNVAKTTRASSLRFAPSVSGTTTAVSKSTSASSNVGGVTVNPSARLSIGKYLNVGANKPGTGTVGSVSTVGTGTGGASSADLNDLHNELDNVQDKIDKLSDGKQAALVLPDGSFLDISGADHNEISVDIEALREDLRKTLRTKDDLLIELDSDNVLWWCYAKPDNAEQCLTEKQVIVDLGKVLEEYDFLNAQTLKKAILGDVGTGAEGILTEGSDGLISINKTTGEIGIKYDDLKDRLGISSLRGETEMRVQNGVLQWRYTNEFEADGVTPKWTTVSDLTTLLDGYVQTSEFDAFKNAITETVNGKQIKLTPATDGLISLTETGVIGVEMSALKEALGIDASVDSVRIAEMRVDGDKLQWHYTDEGDTWNTLDLSQILVPYVTKDYLMTNYYTKSEVNDLAQGIEDGINETLAKLALPENGPTDSGIYMLTVADDGGDKVSSWTSVNVIGADGELLY